MDPHNESIDNCPTSGTSSSDTAVKCSDLPADCLLCNFNCTCVYGEKLNVTCRPKPKVSCTPGGTGSIGHEVVKEMVCQYCYQTEEWQHFCTGYSKCNSVDTPRPLYTSNCTVGRDVVCLGRRNFLKRRECNWTSGYHWSSALFLSITLGGFGADRFYLGHWQEGIGKLFSFGGLGVWTIIDVILIAIRYLGPADGSLYV
ncbi:hypothetical protein HAZT_HAZT000809 [Hyalella azteca]|uniref:TM2 domain-containing protein n=1 Tax=Hyalella azteca TaxID=294128 RepID=A0A6A0GZ67_HYAAZ|nr:hypothetical protein HAZT_HAZT000809 [Hyalella azteca]